MTDKKTAKLPNMTRNYSVVPETIDVENRRVEVVWTSGARALQFNFELGEYLEELEVSTQAINMERLASGSAPFLNMHDGYSLSSILGVVEKAWIDEDKGEGRAVIRFPKDDPEIDRVWNLVAQGILRNISVGYTVEAYEKYEEAGKFIYRAVKWTPLELSAVTVPADAKATVRASEAHTNDCVIISTRSTSTTTKEKIMKRSKRENDEIDDDELDDETRNDEENQDATPENDKDRTDETDDNEKRSEEEDEECASSRSSRSAISRRDHIFALCEVAGLSISEARQYMTSKLSIDEIRSKIMSKRSAKVAGISNSRGVNNTSTKTLSQRAAEVYAKRK